MGRLRRFEHSRFLGTRDDMRFYDCDDPDQFAMLEARMNDYGPRAGTLISAIAPDTAAEARNRGYRAVSG